MLLYSRRKKGRNMDKDDYVSLKVAKKLKEKDKSVELW